MRILTADDDLTCRAFLSALLGQYGHEAIPAIDGVEALSILKSENAPSLVILDWMMPNMSGCDVCRQVRTLPTNNPPYIILLTTRDTKRDIAEGLRAGANDYLPKPYDPEELIARVEVGCRMIQLQAQLNEKIAELNEAMAQIKTLRGIVSICAQCKKIRDDRGYWNQVEEYVGKHSEACFSHGLCPECIAASFPDLKLNENF